MSQYLPIMVLANNDSTLKFSLRLNNAVLPLTGFTPKVYQKATAQSPDSGAIVYQVGSGITIVSSLLGQLNLIIPRANVPTPGTQWWRLDLVDGSGGVATALYGPMTVKAV